MEKEKRGDGLLDPQNINKTKAKNETLKVPLFNDGLIERTERKVIINNDGRELLNEENLNDILEPEI